MNAITTKLTAEQKRAVEREVKRQTVEIVSAYEQDLDTAFIYALHKEFGFGAERCKRLYKAYFEKRREIKEEYQSDGDDGIMETAMNFELLRAGIDVGAWYKEFGDNRFIVSYKR